LKNQNCHLSLALLFIFSTLIPTVSAQAEAPAPDTNALVRNAFKATSLQSIEPPKEDITIKFPSTGAGQTELTAVLKKGDSWSKLPIGAYLGLGNLSGDSLATLAQKVYENDASSATQMTQGSLANLKFLNAVPVKKLVDSFPQLSNVRIDQSQLGSWSSCSASVDSSNSTLGQIATSTCGDSPIPLDVQQLIPISQTGLENIPYSEIANNLNIRDLPASDFPLAKDVTFDKVFNLTNTNINGTNLMKVDHLETKIPGKGGSKIRGINSVSGSNRVPNSTCKDAVCDYAVMRSFLLGTSADKLNPFNNNLSTQINKPGTTWLDGGIGTFGRTLWNFKEPPGLEPPFSSEYMKVVLEDGNARAGTVQQKAYFAFCVTIAFELNCSSKFIGPLPIPWPQVSEKNKAMLFPMVINAQVPVTTPGATPALTAARNGAFTNQPFTSSASQPFTSLSSLGSSPQAYSSLFGPNTLNSYSPVSNISNGG
jgi:hypothetical protein